MSFLNTLREKAAPVEGLVNDEKLEKPETPEGTLEKANDDEPIPADVKEQDTDVNAEEADVKKLEGVEKLLEFQDDVVNTPVGNESVNNLAKLYFQQLEKEYGIKVAVSNEGILADIGNAVKETFFDLIHFGNKLSAPIISEKLLNILSLDSVNLTGFNNLLSRILKDMKAFDLKDVAKFNEKIVKYSSKYVDENGKLPSFSDAAKQIKEFDAKVANGVAKILKEAKAKIGPNVSSVEEATTIVNNIVKNSGLPGLTLELPGFKVGLVYNESKQRLSSSVEKAGLIAGKAKPIKMDFKECLKFMEELQANWSNLEKLANQNQNTWEELQKRIKSLVTEISASEAAASAAANTLVSVCATACKQVSHTFEYPTKLAGACNHICTAFYDTVPLKK